MRRLEECSSELERASQNPAYRLAPLSLLTVAEVRAGRAGRGRWCAGRRTTFPQVGVNANFSAPTPRMSFRRGLAATPPFFISLRHLPRPTLPELRLMGNLRRECMVT